MRGSAVLIKQNGAYRKGHVGTYIYRDLLEVYQPGYFGEMKNRVEQILDEKPHAHDLARGTLVLGEDVNSPGLIREGKIEQIGDTSCTIKTNDETWKSNLNDVRVVKIPDFCPS